MLVGLATGSAGTGLARAMTFDRAVQAGLLDRLHEIVDRIHVERLDRMVAVGGHEYNRRRILELIEGLGKLQTRRSGHRDIQEYDVDPRPHEHLDGGADARRLGDGADLARLLQEETQLRARRGLVIDDHRT